MNPAVTTVNHKQVFFSVFRLCRCHKHKTRLKSAPFSFLKIKRKKTETISFLLLLASIINQKKTQQHIYIRVCVLLLQLPPSTHPSHPSNINQFKVDAYCYTIMRSSCLAKGIYSAEAQVFHCCWLILSVQQSGIQPPTPLLKLAITPGSRLYCCCFCCCCLPLPLLLPNTQLCVCSSKL